MLRHQGVLGSSLFNEASLTYQKMTWQQISTTEGAVRENYVGLLTIGAPDFTQDLSQKKTGIRDDNIITGYRQGFGCGGCGRAFSGRAVFTWACFFPVLGNSFPCFHGFRGGKGVANYLGFTALIAPWAALLAAVIWLVVYGIVRNTFIASFFMIFTLALGQAFTLDWHFSAITGVLATFMLILFNHRKNIVNYRKKTES